MNQPFTQVLWALAKIVIVTLMFSGVTYSKSYASDNGPGVSIGNLPSLQFGPTNRLYPVTQAAVLPPGSWQAVIPISGNMQARHESAFVESGGKFYLLGGRGVRPVQMYDPAAKVWTTKINNVPLELNHIQAIAYNGLIYIINAFTGTYPHETPVPNIYIYNPVNNNWSVGPTIPVGRRRGSSGVVVYNNKFYIFCGITDGHWSGWVPWTDEYDPNTNTWTTLPNAPRARDHAQAALVGNKVYLAGGRRSSGISNQVFDITVPEVDVYDLVNKTWSTLPNNIPTQRAGVSVAVLGEEVVVIGGESMAQGTAHAEAEALNVNTKTWHSLTKLLQGRHGTQPIVYTNKIFIAAGSAKRGGGPELNTMEVYQAGSAVNQAPVVSNAIPNQTAKVGTPFNFTFAANTFSDPDGNPLTYSASLSTGAALPTWLTFTAGTRTFSSAAPSNSISPLSIKVTASDSKLQANTTFSLTINPAANRAPVVANIIPNQTATVGTLFNFTFAANTFSDPDGNPLTYSASLSTGAALPTWLTFTAGTRTFSSAAPSNSISPLSIKVTASDGQLPANTTFSLSINPAANRAPVVSNTIPNQSATVGIAYSFTFAANTFSDPDGNPLTYSASLSTGAALPTWLTFTAGTRTFSSASPSNSTSPLSIKVTASDSKLQVSTTFSLTVNPANRAPVVANVIPNQSATVGVAYNFTFAANTFSDPDGNPLTYSASLSTGALPTWLSFNASTRTFSSAAPSNSTSPLSIKVTANDSKLQTSTTFSLTVNPATTGQQVVNFTLINADTDLELQTLPNGAILNLTTLPTKNLNIRANTSPDKVGSVVFNLSGKQIRNFTEGKAPYALFGDLSGNYHVWMPAVGSYTLKATPFSAGSGGGTAGTALTINFTVINQAGARMEIIDFSPISPSVSAYPNPITDGRFKIPLSEEFEGEVSYVLVYPSGVLLARGTLTLTEPTSVLALDFSQQMRTAGVYYLRLEGKKLKGFLKLQRQ